MRKCYLKIWISILILLLAAPLAHSCTRILYTKANGLVLVGNNMDWMTDLKTNLFVFPRGMLHDGKVDVNPIRWTSQYGSIVASAYDDISTNGMNEKGLAAHFLVLMNSDYGKRDTYKPGISIELLVQFYLDNFASVNEAVTFTEKENFQIETHVDPKSGMLMRLHIALEDAGGDSAIIEFIDGKPQIFHGKQYRILTNDPPYEQQLMNLKKYEVFGGTLPLPGTSHATDRFVRASYYLEHLPDANTSEEAVHHLLSVLNNAASPYFSVHGSGHFIGATIWRTVSDLTHKVYYFHNTLNNNIIWTNLAKFDFSVGQKVKKLNMVDQPDLVGDVSKKFVEI